MSRMIAFKEERDELFFNAIGHGFIFPIDSADAFITLPKGTPILDTNVFTGPQGSKAQDATITTLSDGQVKYTLTSPLSPNEGMSVAIAWPKGVVTEPEPSPLDTQETSNDSYISIYFPPYTPKLIALFGTLFLLIYLLWAWKKVGKDPRKNAIFARFTPPENLSPAACNYIYYRGFRPESISVALINLVIKGYFDLTNPSRRSYVFTRTSKEINASEISQGESTLLAATPDTGSSLDFNGKYQPAIRSLRGRFARALKMEHGKSNYKLNRTYYYFSFPFLIITLLGMYLTHHNLDEVLIGTVTAAICACIILFISTFVQKLSQILKLRGWKKWLSIVQLFAPIGFIIFFLDIKFDSIRSFDMDDYPLFTSLEIMMYPLFVSVALTLMFVFKWLLESPTVAGQRLMEQIEGFKLYLGIAEQDRLNFQHPPEITPELFEAYLPYAIALDVENEWGDQYASHIQHTTYAQAPKSNFTSRLDHIAGSGSLGSALVSGLSSSIASASRPPSSKSSRSGGFSRSSSSGGGGGGGGGGGW